MAVTTEQLLRHREIVGLIQEFADPATPLTQYYGFSSTTRTKRTPTREFAEDIVNPTRLLAGPSAPMSEAREVRPKVIGQFRGTCLRIREKIKLFDEQIMNYRIPGKPVGTLDASGQSFVGINVKHLLQRRGNAIEFMIARTLTGRGYAIKVDDDDRMSLAESGASGSIHNIDPLVPSTNEGNCDGIFSDLWSSASTNIPGQFLDLGKASERLTGMPVRVGWVNSTGYKNMQQNNHIRSVAGDYVTIFSMQDGRQLQTIPDGTRESGYLVKFAAIPQMVFIVCDVCQNVDQVVDSQTSGNSSLLIPDGRCLLTPLPGYGDWYGMAEACEPIRELPSNTAPVQRYGFYSWTKPIDDPSGRELHIVDNCLPYLKVPQAVYYATIA